MAGVTSPTRKFLMQQPRPVKVRLHVTGEPQPRVMALQPGVPWAKFADSIDALQPRIIECLDAEGQMLRAHNSELEPPDEGALEEDDPTAPVLSDGPLETFARLLADAHRTSSERSFQFVETAFARMVDIVNAQTKRMDSMEKAVEGMYRTWRSAYEQRISEEGGAAPEGGGDLTQNALIQQMLAQFFAGAAQVPKAANGVNGAGHPPKGTT